MDEAQALPVDSLEELRMLSNFQAGGHALLQIVLLGQPEFRDRLQGSDRLEQLRQRVIAIHHLDPMAEEEVAPYVAHRLNMVGWSGRPEFTDTGFAALFRASDGVPRRLNQLANRVMLHAAVEGHDVIDAGVVGTVSADLLSDLPAAKAAASAAPSRDAMAPPAGDPAWIAGDVLEHAARSAADAAVEPGLPIDARGDRRRRIPAARSRDRQASRRPRGTHRGAGRRLAPDADDAGRLGGNRKAAAVG